MTSPEKEFAVFAEAAGWLCSVVALDWELVLEGCWLQAAVSKIRVPARVNAIFFIFAPFAHTEHAFPL